MPLLHSYLHGHPEIYVPSDAEINYFSNLKMEDARNEMQRRLKFLGNDWIGSNNSSALIGDFYADRIASLGHTLAVLGGKVDYMSLFDSRPKGVKAYGEMSPSYSLLSRDVFADMAGRHENTRFIFVMRDPVMRFWSSIVKWYNISPRIRATKSVQELFYERLLTPTSNVVLFSRYGRVINELEAVVPRDRIHYDFYEHFFSPYGQTHLDKLTDFLGVSRREGALDRRVWETDTKQVKQSDLTQTMRDDAREVFDQVYKVVRGRFGDAAPASWLWETDTAKATVASAGGSRS